MNNEEKRKFEELASFFHEKKDLNASENPVSVDDADFRAVKDIYEKRELVNQIEMLTPTKRAWGKVKIHLGKQEGRSFYVNIYHYISYAAAILIVFGILFHFMGGRRFLTSKSARQLSEEWVSVIPDAGQITVISFCDGTTISLNSGSCLKYPKHFSKNYRKVFLRGEALFNVKKDSQHPFEVDLGKSKLLVWGTVFNVKNGVGNNKTEVVLERGKVEYKGARCHFFIRPQQRIREDQITGEAKVDRVNPQLYTSWISGKIYFEKERLCDLLERLSKLYQVHFEYENEDLKDFRFTGLISDDQSIQYNLNIIQLTNKIKFIREKNRVIVTN